MEAASARHKEAPPRASDAALTPWERFGGALFRARSATPVVLLLVVLLWPTAGGVGLRRLAASGALIVLGEGLRLWGVGVAGKLTRTRGANVKELVTSGPFAIVRNPLYVANFGVAYGLVVLSKVGWLQWAFPPLFAVQYAAIVAWEERILAAAFGDAYERYRRTVRRWVPSRPRLGEADGRAWAGRIAWRSERDTLLGLAALAAVLIAKHLVFHADLALWWDRAGKLIGIGQ
jgi:protein-S-isoprenylcysteine O-methyltransferase Ste14